MVNDLRRRVKSVRQANRQFQPATGDGPFAAANAARSPGVLWDLVPRRLVGDDLAKRTQYRGTADSLWRNSSRFAENKDSGYIGPSCPGAAAEEHNLLEL